MSKPTQNEVDERFKRRIEDLMQQALDALNFDSDEGDDDGDDHSDGEREYDQDRFGFVHISDLQILQIPISANLATLICANVSNPNNL